MTKAIRIHQFGGPEVMRWEDITVGDPGPGEALVRHTAVGLNFIDVYHRSGLYPLPLPAILGMEGAGVVEAVGDGVGEVRVGDRVAYANPPPGSYAERRLMPSHRLVALPKDIDDRQAAAVMLQGMTAQYLLRRTYRVQAGDTILVHAAAGGVGLMMCQWAKHLGVTVIAAHCAAFGTYADASRPGTNVPAFDLFLELLEDPRYAGRLFGEISALTVFNRLGLPGASDPLRRLLERPDLHARLVNGSDYPIPAVNTLVRTRRLAHLGYLTWAEREALNEIYDYNPLLFDFVVKRTVRHPETGARFSNAVFQAPEALLRPPAPATTGS